jgi:hypothetical protein
MQGILAIQHVSVLRRNGRVGRGGLGNGIVRGQAIGALIADSRDKVRNGGLAYRAPSINALILLKASLFGSIISKWPMPATVTRLTRSPAAAARAA